MGDEKIGAGNEQREALEIGQRTAGGDEHLAHVAIKGERWFRRQRRRRKDQYAASPVRFCTRVPARSVIVSTPFILKYYCHFKPLISKSQEKIEISAQKNAPYFKLRG